MFADARVEKIKEILLEYKHVDMSTLCSLLSVSMATIRRDLDKLEQEGFLTKAHGGAILKDLTDAEVLLTNVEDPFIGEKKQIGIIAAALVEDNDIIFLGGGNTILQIAKNLRDKTNINLITNNINVVFELANCKNINLKLVGGDLEKKMITLLLTGS